MKLFNEQKQEYIDLINKRLDELIPLCGNEYDKVIEAMRYSVNNAGKRIRPILVLAFCKMDGGDIKSALNFACAIEMIHCYSLIHDDLPCMDDDDLRRGKPSCHKQFDEAIALLAGDALLTKAFEVVSIDNDFSQSYPDRIVKITRLLSNYAGVNGMIGGQVIDLETEKGGSLESSISFELLKKMQLLKTSALIQMACEVGAIVSGSNDEAQKTAKTYGENVGFAFQLIDDILDITSTSEKLGKPVGSDIENEKMNFISICGLEKTYEMANEYTNKAMLAIECQKTNDKVDTEFIVKLTEELLKRDY